MANSCSAAGDSSNSLLKTAYSVRDLVTDSETSNDFWVRLSVWTWRRWKSPIRCRYLALRAAPIYNKGRPSNRLQLIGNRETFACSLSGNLKRVEWLPSEP